MGEDCIEQAHQSRAKIGSQLMRLRDKSKLMDLQAKMQNFACLQSINYIQDAVKADSKRKNVKQNISLKTERNEIKR